MQKRLQHGVLGYSRWKNSDFLDAISHWYRTQFAYELDQSQLVYGPSVIYMVGKLIELWSTPGDGIISHTPCYDAFYKVVEGNQRKLIPSPLQKQGDQWQCDMAQLAHLLAQPKNKILLLAAHITQQEKCGVRMSSMR